MRPGCQFVPGNVPSSVARDDCRENRVGRSHRNAVRTSDMAPVTQTGIRTMSFHARARAKRVDAVRLKRLCRLCGRKRPLFACRTLETRHLSQRHDAAAETSGGQKASRIARPQHRCRDKLWARRCLYARAHGRDSTGEASGTRLPRHIGKKTGLGECSEPCACDRVRKRPRLSCCRILLPNRHR